GGGGDDTRAIFHKNDDLFVKICSIENLFLAWDKFCKGKRSRLDIMSYELWLEDNIFYLHNELRSGRYQHDPYEPFVVHDPKRRQINKASVKDRIVHQAVFNIIEPIFERSFIFDSYSCRTGKGTHAAVNRLRYFLDKTSSNNTRTVLALKCDIKQFFASVDHGVLIGLLTKQISCNRSLRLLQKIISSFSVGQYKGIPLGNLTSQLFANIYMHELDHFVKCQLREKYYLRYCDDFIILHQDARHLEQLIPIIQDFLQTKLCLSVHPDKTLKRTPSQGIDFVGYVLLERVTVLRNKTVKRMIQRVNQENKASYLGLCSHASTHELQKRIKNML
ncbi:reverse transcriptase/maturase family protein, partial [Patescibacteria group bacterium]|nr:reverse transcriptase/maturase family protein [Patescibacteria group bacterium]MBU1907093.1 reverse transcriptase/maturase family protein [Patescibacteria group bacterium]